MPHRIEAAKMTAISLAGSGANYVAVASAASGLTQQLNQTHPFLYLDLPIWLFFAAAVILSMMGSLVSLFIDLMATPPPSVARLAINLILGFLIGIIGAFVILPSVTAAPPMPLLLLTALSMSLLGTVIIRNIGEVLRSAELWQSIKTIIKDVIIEALEVAKKIAIERWKLFLALIFGGHSK